uniref:TLR23g n=1 Tax=Mugilogobius chulae TaxID=88201 RepID=A0A9E8DBP9_9GOBI|nr:TLR23g [Mugilogobius chulae]
MYECEHYSQQSVDSIFPGRASPSDWTHTELTHCVQSSPVLSGSSSRPVTAHTECEVQVGRGSIAVMPFLDVLLKSECKPRDTLVDVYSEYPEDTEYIYIPSCVVLSRCGGCCQDEAMECVPTQTHNVTLEVMRSRPLVSQHTLQLRFTEHSRCECSQCAPCSERRKRLFIQDPLTCSCSCKYSHLDCTARKLELNERTCSRPEMTQLKYADDTALVAHVKDAEARSKDHQLLQGQTGLNYEGEWYYLDGGKHGGVTWTAVQRLDCGGKYELSLIREFRSNYFFCGAPHQDTFIYTPHLQELYVKNNFEFDAFPELFHPLTELKNLELSGSLIKSVDFLFDANLTKLELLGLNGNEIKVVNKTVFNSLPSLKYLELSGNPFACNCSNAGFIDWVIRNKQVFVSNAFHLKCASLSEEGHLLMDFNVQSCWDFTGFLCFMSSSALVLLTLLSSFIFHFLRWQLVYGFYLLQAFLYDTKKRRQRCHHIYDAFVSYNVHDEEWVYGELVPELEEVQGWRLCLHHRDFQPGKPIIENITDAIYSSRKTLCVISRRYLQSEWCSREIQMASFRLFDEQKDVLILLFLEEISSNQLSPVYRMRKLVKSRTYLSWTQARSHKGLFWEKVRRALESGNEPGDNHNPLTANV